MDPLFTNFVRSNDITFKYARGISDRSGKEFHPFHEIIYFLDGDAEFISEHLHMKLQPKTLLVIPRETYHQMLIQGDQQRYHRCALQFTSHAGLGWHSPGIMALHADEELRYLFGKLIGLSKQPEDHAPALLNALLTLLLDTLQHKEQITDRKDLQSAFIRQVTDYINDHVEEKLHLAQIADALNVSVSSLSHIFKKEMNISLHKFILKKRLINAHHMIAAGSPATEAAAQCGFADYSGFYKQYKKMFGTSPSQEQPVESSV